MNKFKININNTKICLYCDPVTNTLEDSLVGSQGYYISSFIKHCANTKQVRTYFTNSVGDLIFFHSIDDAIDHAKKKLPAIIKND